jgi:enterochelin esterase family protein
MPQRLDRLMGGGEVAPAIVVMPDCWTRLGSSQYLNSAIGNYEDYLINEIIPYVDGHYPTNKSRAVLGHSSGGYGAIVQAMRHPEVFDAVACHAGDMYWEFTCMPGVAGLHQGLEKYGGAENFLKDIDDIQPKGGAFWKTVMTMCWSMAHGTNPDAPLGFDLPIDPDTGARDEAVWARWLAFDPVRMIDESAYQSALKSMKLVYITAGLYDEYQLQVGARIFCKKLAALGVNFLHEEQAVGHSGSDVPYDRSIALLVAALNG